MTITSFGPPGDDNIRFVDFINAVQFFSKGSPGKINVKLAIIQVKKNGRLQSEFSVTHTASDFLLAASGAPAGMPV